MKHLHSVALLLLASVAGVLSESIVLYNCLSVVTNGGAQTELSYYGMDADTAFFFTQRLDQQYRKSCKKSALRFNTFDTADKGTAVQISAFAKGHSFDDVEGCAKGSVKDAAGSLSLSLETDPSFEGCIRFDPNQPLARRGQGPRRRGSAGQELEARGVSLNPNITPNLGDTVQLATGAVLTVGALATGDQDNSIDPDLVLQILPQLSQALGSLGVTSGGTIQSVPGSLNPPFLEVSFDAAINQGAGAINADDWRIIVGTMTRLFTRTNKRMISAAFEIGGIVVLTVTIGSLF